MFTQDPLSKTHRDWLEERWRSSRDPEAEFEEIVLENEDRAAMEFLLDKMFEQGRTDKALEFTSRYVNVYANSAHAHWLMVALAYRARSWRSCTSHLACVCRLEPEHPEPTWWMARLRARDARGDAASLYQLAFEKLLSASAPTLESIAQGDVCHIMRDGIFHHASSVTALDDALGALARWERDQLHDVDTPTRGFLLVDVLGLHLDVDISPVSFPPVRRAAYKLLALERRTGQTSLQTAAQLMAWRSDRHTDDHLPDPLVESWVGGLALDALERHLVSETHTGAEAMVFLTLLEWLLRVCEGEEQAERITQLHGWACHQLMSTAGVHR